MSGPRSNPVNDQDLTQTLNERADDFARLGGHDLDLAQVVSRAGEIRRGRRMRASMVMAAVVLAVAVPVGIVAVGSSGGDPTPTPQPTSSTNPTPTETPKVTDQSPLGIGDLPVGDTTEVGLQYGTKIVLPDRSLELGKGGQVRAIAWVGGGFLVARDSGSGQRVSYTAIEDGGTDLTWPYGGSGFAVSSDRKIGAFVEPDGTVRAVQDSGSLNFAVGRLPAGDSYVVDAVQGENCSGRSDLDTGCTVYLHSTGEHPAVWSVSPHAAATKLTEDGFRGLLNLIGISATGDVAGMTRSTDSGSCWSVRSSDGVERWSTCKYALLSFSGDGAYVLAGGAYRSGAGDTTFAVLNARTGEVVLELKTAKDAFIAQRAWEDGNNVIVSVYDSGRWAIERINVLTGERQFAGSLAEGGDGELTPADDGSMVSPFQLSASR